MLTTMDAWVRAVALGFLFVLLGTFAAAQTATLSGTISDRTGAVIADAHVQVVNISTNATVSTTTNGAGLYVATSLAPGQYRVIVTKQGFKQVTLTDLTLSVQDSVSRNFSLEVGATSESVTVEGNAGLVETDLPPAFVHVRIRQVSVEPLPFSVTSEVRGLGQEESFLSLLTRVSRTPEAPSRDSGVRAPAMY